MTPVVERKFSKSKPLKKNRTDPMWTDIFKVIGEGEKDIDQFIDWLSDQGLERLYWLAPSVTWKKKLSEESERRKKLKELDNASIQHET